MNVAIYTRKSVYIEGSISIETQVNLCKDYINKNYENVKFQIFEDEGYSGGNTNRPAFQKMLKLIELKEIDIVVCYKVDRIARNTLDFLKLLETFKEKNVQLISISEGFDPNTQIGRMMLILLASFAEMERSNIQQRVKDNMFALAKKGCWTGGSAPTGFKIGEHGGLEIANKEMILDFFNMKAAKKLSSDIIEYIYETYSHKFSTRTLGSACRKPIYVKSSKEVSMYLKSKGYKIIGFENNKNSYLTYTENNEKYAIVSNIEGIVEPDIWLNINKEMDANITREGNRFSADYWLTKTIRCKCCGKTYAGQTKNIKTKYITKDGTEKVYETTKMYYMCRDMFKGKLKTCPNTKRITKESLETKIDEYIYSLKNFERFNNLFNINKIDNSFLIKGYNAKIKNLDKTINNLTDKISLLSNEASLVFINKIEELVQERNKFKEKIVSLEIEELNSTTNTSDNVFQSILLFNRDMNNDEKRALVMSIFKEIVYDHENDTFEVTFNR